MDDHGEPADSCCGGAPVSARGAAALGIAGEAVTRGASRGEGEELAGGAPESRGERSAWTQGQGMDWGTVALYCCEDSCAATEEFVVVRPPIG